MLMNETLRPVLWDDLVDTLKSTRRFVITKRTQWGADDESDTGSTTSKQSETSRYNLTARERQTIRSLDHRSCFVTNTYSHGGEVAHILGNHNAGNRSLVDSLRGLGVVHPNFNLADISNLILMSRELHYLWDKYAAFVIVPSQATRAEMIDIIQKDRDRARLAALKGETVYPCQLVYPKTVTYDILFFQPSLFGSPGLLFPHADGHPAKITYYLVPSSTPLPEERQEYLIKLDDDTRVREFQNIRHMTGRSGNQAVNPYLMVMNAFSKLDYWKERSSFSDDPVLQAALEDCSTILYKINARTGGKIYMKRDYRGDQTQGSKEDDMVSKKDSKNDGEMTPRSSTRSLEDIKSLAEEELKSPGDADFDTSMMKSWISRGGVDKAQSLESWRLEVSRLVVPDQQGLVSPEQVPFAGMSRQICQNFGLV